MYVTDVPVFDRITDPLSRAVGDAIDALDAELADLDMTVWKLEQAETVPEGLSEARDAVLSASQQVSEALAAHGIEAL